MTESREDVSRNGHLLLAKGEVGFLLGDPANNRALCYRHLRFFLAGKDPVQWWRTSHGWCLGDPSLEPEEWTE